MTDHISLKHWNGSYGSPPLIFAATQLDSLHACLKCLHRPSYGVRRRGQENFHFFFGKWTAVQNQRYASGIRRLEIRSAGSLTGKRVDSRVGDGKVLLRIPLPLQRIVSPRRHQNVLVLVEMVRQLEHPSGSVGTVKVPARVGLEDESCVLDCAGC